ncbi:hypothetical protein FFLO_04801 [Filobasidium floriforme]|uniref:Uncharacterized protein n=1 Tax=Filobasidium floriforme TaxID=5210 RepID=A0A8K0JI39_9TREE|nr:hypothetical protein FFLO_04801 [Filobasidium floriforme]
MPSGAELAQLFETIDTSVIATTKTLSSLFEKAESDPTHPDLDYSAGLTLLTVRPQLLLASLHQLVIMLGLRLSTLLAADESEEDDEEELDNDGFTRTFVAPASRPTLDTVGKVEKAIEEELRVIREVMEKTKALESKVSYQVKKLVALASSAGSATQTKGESSGNKNEDDEEEEQDQLSYKPNIGAILSSKAAGKARDVDQDDEDRDDARAKRRIKNSRRSLTPSDEDDEQAGDGIYRPPRLGAIPYNEGRRDSSKRADRRAPALLSEFADSLTNAPGLESTSGLSVRPVVASDNLRSNSTSAKRMAELQRMTEFEEENMTRLVMRKRDAKRREEDESALLMGYGVGGEQRSRSRRQGGFEAELEGVLGDRGNSKGMWDDVGKGLGKRDSMLERSRKRPGDDVGGAGGPKKRRFEKAVKKHKR